MGRMQPSMRLKVKADTFFLPDSNGGVYFRNNEGSFRMEGRTIYQWVEKLLPVFTGEITLADVTEGLPEAYCTMVYDIAQVLYQNGVVRDVSLDAPHQLQDDVCQHYRAQIEFLDELAGSGASRFQTYRETSVLAIGAGPFVVSLAEALLTSGLPKFHLLLTEALPTNRKRLRELERYQRKSDRDANVKLLNQKDVGTSWNEIVKPYDAIVYVSECGDVGELRALNRACKAEQKKLLPAIVTEQVGLAGPLVHPDSSGCFESAWRRLHQPVLGQGPQSHAFSPVAGAMLANLIVFELFKTITGVLDSPLRNQLYLLNLETLEGAWRGFLPHPLVAGHEPVSWLSDAEIAGLLARAEDDSGDPQVPADHCNDDHCNADHVHRLIPYFDGLTSAECGILHLWAEDDLTQVPSAQCRVQAVNAATDGPAATLPEVVCTCLTHEQARREAGLRGIEAYAASLLPALAIPGLGVEEFVGVAAGETFEEALLRGVRACLQEARVRQAYPQQTQCLHDTLTALRQHGITVAVLNLSVEPFMRETIAGVFGVVLREAVDG